MPGMYALQFQGAAMSAGFDGVDGCHIAPSDGGGTSVGVCCELEWGGPCAGWYTNKKY